MQIKTALPILILICFVLSCKKPYTPPAVTTITNYLVVEGLINTGSDSTVITLSRTVKLDATTTLKPELHAAVNVQSDNNAIYPLTELENGRYASPLNLNSAQKYRLHIVTADGVEYASEFASSINTPAIDSILYRETNTGVQLYVNTHDPTNSTRYYRWSFEETWQYVSYYNSVYKILNNKIVLRSSGDDVYTCYKTQVSKEILIGSSAKLAQDVIFLQPINFATVVSGKISHGYSFLLKQHGLSLSAYNYWNNLKKNTEQLGSIFDAQPSTLTGNIKCITHPEVPVLGFISVSTVKSHRIFIDHNSLALYTPSYISPPDSAACHVIGLAVEPASTYDQRFNNIFGRGFNTPIGSISNNGLLISYICAPNECADCRLKSPFGTTVKPPFWK